MKIAVIGANGKTGKVFVDEAVQYGHEVHAGVYRTNSFTQSDYIKTMQCDAMKLDDVEKLIKGCDAVVSLIGHGKDSPAFLQTAATCNILSAMKRHHISRFVSLTGTGVRTDGDTPSYLDKMLNQAIRIIDPARIRDGKAHADVIIESDVDWTIIRVLKLTDFGPHKYRLTNHGPARMLASRATVAAAILDVLVEGYHIKSMPVVSKP